MKKKFSIILIVLILISSCFIPVYAEEDEKYDVSINIPNFMVFDDNSSIDEEEQPYYVVTIKTCNMWDIKEIDLCYNTEEIGVKAPEHPFVEPIYRRVQTGARVDDDGNYHLVFSWEKNENDDYSEENPLYGEHKNQYIVISTGEYSFNAIGGTVTTFDGTVREAKIKINDYCKIIPKKSELIKLDDGSSSDYVVIDEKKTVTEILSRYSAPEMQVSDFSGTVLGNNDIVGTGTVVDALFMGYSYDRRTIVYMEDVNCDAKITAADARLALRCSAKLENIEEIQLLAADMNDDTKITAADARLILRKAAKLD